MSARSSKKKQKMLISLSPSDLKEYWSSLNMDQRRTTFLFTETALVQTVYKLNMSLLCVDLMKAKASKSLNLQKEATDSNCYELLEEMEFLWHQDASGGGMLTLKDRLLEDIDVLFTLMHQTCTSFLKDKEIMQPESYGELFPKLCVSWTEFQCCVGGLLEQAMMSAYLKHMEMKAEENMRDLLQIEDTIASKRSRQSKRRRRRKQTVDTDELVLGLNSLDVSFMSESTAESSECATAIPSPDTDTGPDMSFEYQTSQSNASYSLEDLLICVNYDSDDDSIASMDVEDKWVGLVEDEHEKEEDERIALMLQQNHAVTEKILEYNARQTMENERQLAGLSNTSQAVLTPLYYPHVVKYYEPHLYHIPTGSTVNYNGFNGLEPVSWMPYNGQQSELPPLSWQQSPHMNPQSLVLPYSNPGSPVTTPLGSQPFASLIDPQPFSLYNGGENYSYPSEGNISSMSNASTVSYVTSEPPAPPVRTSLSAHAVSFYPSSYTQTNTR